jgi:hypothetical protein
LHDTPGDTPQLLLDRHDEDLTVARSAKVSRSKRTGLPTVRLGTAITSEDVRALDDDR